DFPVSGELTRNIRNELLQFKAISCREDSGVDICKSVFGVQASHVLDPLLLVEDAFLNNIISHSSVGKAARLVYYKLDASPAFERDLDAIASSLNTKAINLYLQEADIPKYREVCDWVALIYQADVVVTDSFHCICLALRFGKEVIYSPNDKRGQARMESLFKKVNVETESIGLDLETRMFKLLKGGDIADVLIKSRRDSMAFLRAAIG